MITDVSKLSGVLSEPIKFINDAEEKEKAAAGLRPAVCRDKKAARRHGQLLLYLDYAYSMM